MTVLLHPACSHAPADVADVERGTGLTAIHRSGLAVELVEPGDAPPRVSFCRADKDLSRETVRALVELGEAMLGWRP